MEIKSKKAAEPALRMAELASYFVQGGVLYRIDYVELETGYVACHTESDEGIPKDDYAFYLWNTKGSAGEGEEAIDLENGDEFWEIVKMEGKVPIDHKRRLKNQRHVVRCAIADLSGALQARNMMTIELHDWEAHLLTIHELAEAFDMWGEVPEEFKDVH